MSDQESILEKNQRDIAVVKRNRLVLLLTVFLGIMSLSSYVVWNAYGCSHDGIEKNEQSRLAGIANTLVLQINAADFEAVLKNNPEKNQITSNDQDEAYQRIHDVLRSAKFANGLGSDIYTLSMNPDASADEPAKAFFFGVTSSNPYFRDPYAKPPMQLFELYETGGVLDRFSSENDTYVAAVAPILSQEGKVIGVVEVDKQVDELIAAGKQRFQETLIRVGTITLLVLGITFLLVYMISQRMVRKLESVVSDADGNRKVYNTLSVFAEQIGQGIYDSDMTSIEQLDNSLAQSLISMRANLETAKIAETKRNWSIQGQADFGELLREHNTDLEELCQAVISTMIKSLNAQQGILYVLTEENGETFLELKGSFAVSEDQLNQTRIALNEGLVGQCLAERNTMNLKDVPAEFAAIESGLGKAEAVNLILVPLMHYEEAQGVMEIACLRELEPFEIQFIEEVGKSIGSSILLVKGHAQTANLLRKSEEMTDKMQLQEEENRQRSEELQRIQEELKRRVAELEAGDSKSNSKDAE